MDLNLRKARKLEAKIQVAINQKKSELSTNASIRVNTDPANISTLVDASRLEFFENYKLVNDLTLVRQEIRDLIAKANFNVGIDDLISNKVLLETKLQLLNSFTNVEIFKQEDLEDTLSLYKKQLEGGSAHYARTNASYYFLNQVDKDKFRTDRQNTQKEIEALEDKLAELNYSSKVRLNSTTTKLLQDNGLI